MPRAPKPDKDFYEIDKSGCWNFSGSLSHNGYGQMKRGGKHLRATHYFYRKYVGEFADGLQIDHLCRNVQCVNPKHLEPVTAAENTRRSSSAKITSAEAAKIKEMARNGIPQNVIVSRFNVGQSQISRIVTGKRWAA